MGCCLDCIFNKEFGPITVRLQTWGYGAVTWSMPHRHLAFGLYYDAREWSLMLRVMIGEPWSVRIAIGPIACEFGGYPG